MAAFLETKISKEFLTCTICFEIYKGPKSLPCLHSFCEQCITKHIMSKRNARTREGFHCPICRKFVKIPRPKEDIGQWASQLIDDFRIVSLVDALGLQNSTSQTETEVHPTCMQHGNNLDLVCVSCDTVPVCSTCVAVSHRMCTQVYTVVTAAQEKRSTLSYFLGPIEDRLQKVECRQSELVKERNLMVARKDEALRELGEKRDEAIQAIKDKFTELVEKVEEECKECQKTFDLQAELLKTFKEELEKCQANAESVMAESDMNVVNKYYEVKNEIQEKIRGNRDAIAPNVPEYIVAFEPNANLPAKLKELSLGDICVQKREKRLNMLLPIQNPSISLQSMPSPSQASPSGPVSMLVRPCTTIKFVNKVSAKVSGDKTLSCLRDVTIVSGNVIVVTDGDNMAVKSFYTQGLRLQSSQHKTGRLPHGIATLAGNTVAVMVPKQKELLLLDVTPNIILQRKAITAKSYYAVTALSPERLAVSTCPGYGPPSIDIIDTDGQLIQVVRDVANVGNLLSNPMSMQATPQGDIVITDPTLPSIVCIRQNGFKVFDFEPTNEYKIKTPYGVAIDKQGAAILIADKDSNSIMLLSPDGTPLRRLITKSDKMESKPRAVAIGERGMIVTIHEKKICVFQVQ